MNRANKQRGITLVETLVALLIMGLVTSTILVLVGQSTRFAAAAQDRAYASIAADNLMVRELALTGPVETGEEIGEIEIAARQWKYRRIVTETGVSGLFRIEFHIIAEVQGREEEQVIARVTTLRKVS